MTVQDQDRGAQLGGYSLLSLRDGTPVLRQCPPAQSFAPTLHPRWQWASPVQVRKPHR